MTVVTTPNEAAAGLSDTDFISMLRDFMEDPPLFAPQQVQANGTQTEYRLGAFPVFDGDPNLTIINAVGPTTYTQVATRDLLSAAHDVYLDNETGWLFFKTAPAAGLVTIRMSRCRWRNTKLKQALMAGLSAMFPRLWQKKVDDSSLQIHVNQWDYPLPGTDWTDPRTRLLDVEYRMFPVSYERFRSIDNWRRVGLTVLHIPSALSYPPTTQLRLTWAGPYTSLSQLEGQAHQLPLWYAKGYLLSNRETVRVRFDQANATQNEQANPPGVMQNAGAFFMRQFDQELERLKVPMPMARMIYSFNR